MLLKKLQDRAHDIVVGPRLGRALHDAHRRPCDILGLQPFWCICQLQSTGQRTVHLVGVDLDAITPCMCSIDRIVLQLPVYS